MPAERPSQVDLSDHRRDGRRDPLPRGLAPAAAGAAWALLLLLAALCHLCGLHFARQMQAHFMAQLGLWLAAGLLWALALWALRWAPPLRPGSGAERRALLWLWALALLMRGPALALPVGHSDDVYRYLWDGAVQQAGHSPYSGPPDATEYAAVRAAQPELHERINHRELPTIYPPVAQLCFRAHAALSPAAPALPAAVRRWKVLVVAADLLVLVLLIGLCRGEGRDVRWAAAWGAAPLAAVELSYNGHLDSLGLLPLVLALRLWQRAGWALPGQERQRGPNRGGLSAAAAIGALLALAMLVKPIAGAVLPAAYGRPRRVLLALLCGGLLAAALVALPYGGRGFLPPSLGEYGRRWRSNEGVYALVQAGAEAVVRVVYRPPYYAPWRWPRLAHLVTGRERSAVWPDELAAALARAGVLAALVALAVRAVRGRLTPPRLGLVLLLGYQLLTPVLHPWYELWPLALAALWPPLLPPLVVMAALSPLAYLPLPDYLAGRGFHEAVWPRLVQHGAGWLALGLAWRRLAGRALAQERIDALPRRDTLPPQTP